MRQSLENTSKIWICWDVPEHPPEAGVKVLSFLWPKDEEDFIQANPQCEIIRGRIFCRNFKERARQIYIQITAQIGVVKNLSGKTFREALKNKYGESVWWFHKVSEKDCETQPVFDQIIQVLAIAELASQDEASRLSLFGCPGAIELVLKEKFFIEESCLQVKASGPSCLIVLLKRAKFALAMILETLYLKQLLKPPQKIGNVVLSGLWEVSVSKDKNGQVSDRYYKSLPDELMKRSLSPFWLVWFEQAAGVLKSRRTIADSVGTLQGDARFCIAQIFLTPWDIIHMFCNFKYGQVFAGYEKLKEFHRVFKVDGLDFYPLFKKYLREGFLDWTIPREELISLAHRRFAERYSPRCVLSFLDLFIFARAVYSGIKGGCQSSMLLDMQHASCSREKIFYMIDPKLEKAGIPDHDPMPQPDIVFAMGELGQNIFMESGFTKEQVLATGSARYTNVKIQKSQLFPKEKKDWTVLIVSGMDVDAEMHMVDCVHAAFQDQPDVKILLRFHPLADIRKHPRFSQYVQRIECTKGTSLDEDISKADFILFSYSTVGEESLLKGKAVLRWVSEKYDASVFRDIGLVKEFSSIEQLKHIWQEVRQAPDNFLPTLAQQTTVAQQCFFLSQVSAAEQMADKIKEIIL
ncbi:MAG: hypothetical protein HQL26_07590 [Candidatus Omnitrophica bacterium]|nr:hypothetical protein [Candidatus Omnitrophota bacterium]